MPLLQDSDVYLRMMASHREYSYSVGTSMSLRGLEVLVEDEHGNREYYSTRKNMGIARYLSEQDCFGYQRSTDGALVDLFLEQELLSKSQDFSKHIGSINSCNLWSFLLFTATERNMLSITSIGPFYQCCYC